MANINKLMKQAAQMQRQMETIQAELAERTVEYTSGGGAVGGGAGAGGASSGGASSQRMRHRVGGGEGRRRVRGGPGGRGRGKERERQRAGSESHVHVRISVVATSNTFICDMGSSTRKPISTRRRLGEMTRSPRPFSRRRAALKHPGCLLHSLRV